MLFRSSSKFAVNHQVSNLHSCQPKFWGVATTRSTQQLQVEEAREGGESTAYGYGVGVKCPKSMIRVACMRNRHPLSLPSISPRDMISWMSLKRARNVRRVLQNASTSPSQHRNPPVSTIILHNTPIYTISPQIHCFFAAWACWNLQTFADL